MINEIRECDDKRYRLLYEKDNECLVIDCANKTMPVYMPKEEYLSFPQCEEITYRQLSELGPNDKKIAYERYSIIAPIIALVFDEKKRSAIIDRIAKENNLSKQTVRSYLCTYLATQSIAELAPRKKEKPQKELSQDEKNIRWALNKYYYTQHKNSLTEAYTYMLKEKYTRTDCKLLEHPTFYQFRYFYRKTKKLENLYISREGIKKYQRDKRPLLGDGIQQLAPTLGTVLLDGTICDIYLVDDRGGLVGRPILVAAVDANTSLCVGYSLLWEGGVYSLQSLMLNIIEDKQKLCERLGIKITEDQWPSCKLPGIMVSDQGKEYIGETFSQIAELGVKLINLPSYRPELKGSVEKFFDLVQDAFKTALKGKGVIMPDFQSRGAHDYRKDAYITMEQFEKIIVRSIIYYNSERIIKSYPYTDKMLEEKIYPTASAIWNYKITEHGNTFIDVNREQLILTLLPRTIGKFTRFGLKVNNLRYHAEGYKEEYLKGGKCTVCYNPDDISKVWLIDNNAGYVEFTLIEKMYEHKSITEVKSHKAKSKSIINSSLDDEYKAKVDLLNYIEDIIGSGQCGATSLKNIRDNRRRAQNEKHIKIGV